MLSSCIISTNTAQINSIRINSQYVGLAQLHVEWTDDEELEGGLELPWIPQDGGPP